MTTLSVVVPATDRPVTLARCVAALEASTDAPDEVLVVDGPSDLSASEARNVGVDRATGDVVVFVDADVEVHPDAIGRLRAAFDAADPPDAVYGSYDDAPHAPGVVSRFRNLLHHHVHHQAAGPAETFWTGLGAVRRTSFTAVGGFDEDRYPHPSIEDIELGTRLAAAGATILVDPRIQGTHLKRWTLRSMVWTDLARRAIPWTQLLVRDRRSSTALNLSWRHRLSAASCAAVVGAAALGQFLVALGALVALVALNHVFYRLLVRRLGLVGAAAGIGLHGLHHLVSLLAVPIGLALAVVDRRSDQPIIDLSRTAAPSGATGDAVPVPGTEPR